jgi:hypothetical protein
MIELVSHTGLVKVRMHDRRANVLCSRHTHAHTTTTTTTTTRMHAGFFLPMSAPTPAGTCRTRS